MMSVVTGLGTFSFFIFIINFLACSSAGLDLA